MDPQLFVRGFVLGFTIAAAVGPISLLCIRRTLAEGRAIGYASGLGVTGGDVAGAVVLTLGVFAGSGAWWVVLVTVVGALRSRITPVWLRRVNIVSGLLIGAFALIAIGSALVA